MPDRMPSALVLLMAFILAIDINRYFDTAKKRKGWKLSRQKELPELAYSLPLALADGLKHQPIHCRLLCFINPFIAVLPTIVGIS